ncbi:MAG: FAD-dependent oxidoreductase [Bacilli bacterium]|nr:FAD-dependent oxidoreductase [Bacilli bacterium]
MIRIRQIKIPVEKDNIQELRNKICKKIKCSDKDIINIKLSKKSLDARNKPNLYYIYEVDIKISNEEKVLKRNIKNNDILKTPIEEYQLPKLGNKKLKQRPIIIGSGPAGLFSAYLLAELGFNPIIIERGEPVEDRTKTVEHFWNTGELNKNSNVQFGEGGAGTFSDGKLNTLVKDKDYRMKKVFEIFIKCGANPEILYIHNPHIGTDVLRNVIKNMREYIIAMGGTFLYNTCLTNLVIKDNQITGIEINNKDTIATEVLILAIGHSARDTFEMIHQNNITLEPKPFAIGLRVQHPQSMIDKNQYGENYNKSLPPASYKLTYQASNGRGVYSFCMCPGGYVVNASSEKGRLAINGMSYHERNSTNANSAIVVTVSPEDYGYNPLDGMNYQRKLEEKAYNLGNGNIPIQLLKDFHNNVENSNLGNITPIFKGNYKITNLNNLLPEEIALALKEAFPNFDKKIKGFNQDYAILAGIETRTSSPIRITRNDNLESINVKGIYPCGEGAGYAGGITTSAMDGLKVAESIIKKYTY